MEGDPKMTQMSPDEIEELRGTIQRLRDEEDDGLDEAISASNFIRDEIKRLPSAERPQFVQAYEEAIKSVLERFENMIRGN